RSKSGAQNSVSCSISHDQGLSWESSSNTSSSPLSNAGANRLEPDNAKARLNPRSTPLLISSGSPSAHLWEIVPVSPQDFANPMGIALVVGGRVPRGWAARPGAGRRQGPGGVDSVRGAAITYGYGMPLVPMVIERTGR